MRKVRLFLVLLVFLVLGLRETARACTHPDGPPPGVVRSGAPSGTGR